MKNCEGKTGNSTSPTPPIRILYIFHGLSKLICFILLPLTDPQVLLTFHARGVCLVLVRIVDVVPLYLGQSHIFQHTWGSPLLLVYRWLIVLLSWWLQLLSTLIVSLQFNFTFIEVYRIRKFHFTSQHLEDSDDIKDLQKKHFGQFCRDHPACCCTSSSSTWNCDGETLESSAIEVEWALSFLRWISV